MENEITNNENCKFICTTCKELKLNSEFYKVNRSNIKRKYTAKCKICLLKNSNWSKNNKEARKIIANRWSFKNKEAKKISRINYRKAKPINYMFLTTKSNAKKRNIVFNITKEDIENKLILQNYKCFYTNKLLNLELGHKDSMSIDRYDNTLGYEVNNIVICQYKINVMKNDATLNELFEFCELIIQNKKQILNGKTPLYEPMDM